MVKSALSKEAVDLARYLTPALVKREFDKAAKLAQSPDFCPKACRAMFRSFYGWNLSVLAQEMFDAAARRGHYAALRVLLDIFAKEKTPLGVTVGQDAIMNTILTCNPSCLEFFLDYGVPAPGIFDHNRTTILHFAIEHKSLECARVIINRKLIGLEERNYKGDTPFLHAVRQRDAALIALLASCGADANAVNAETGRRALHTACEPFVVDPLVQSLASFAMLDLSPPKRAALGPGAGLEAARELVRLGVAVDALDNAGAAPLHLAAAHGQLAFVRLLVEEGGADVALKDAEGLTAYDTAAHQGHGKVAAYLQARLEGACDAGGAETASGSESDKITTSP